MSECDTNSCLFGPRIPALIHRSCERLLSFRYQGVLAARRRTMPTYLSPSLGTLDPVQILLESAIIPRVQLKDPGDKEPSLHPTSTGRIRGTAPSLWWSTRLEGFAWSCP